MNEIKCSTVAEIITKLQTLPQNAPVYVRSKYTGNTDPFEDYPLSVNGISKMEDFDRVDAWVVFLF